VATVITSTAVCLDRDTHSIIELAARAGEDCIKRSGREKKEINLLINVGVCRDKNIMEPAIVSLVQQRMGFNLILEDYRYRTFSFDILNGVGGMLNAVQAVGAILANGDARCALLLGGDVHPSGTRTTDFPYNAIGAAMLLEWSDNPDKGFQSIEMKTSSDDYIGSSAMINYKKSGADTIKSISVENHPDYVERLTQFTIDTIRDLLVHYRENHAVDPSRIKLITTHPWKGFAKKVAASAGLNGHSVECLYKKYGNPNSSALMVAYHDALRAGRLKAGEHILFLAASAGLNVSAGLYRI